MMDDEPKNQMIFTLRVFPGPGDGALIAGIRLPLFDNRFEVSLPPGDTDRAEMFLKVEQAVVDAAVLGIPAVARCDGVVFCFGRRDGKTEHSCHVVRLFSGYALLFKLMAKAVADTLRGGTR